MGEKSARGVDRRVRRSRRAIIEAFERLIMSYELDEITVSALAREADVDRKTFYQHFGTIDGLLDAIAEQTVSEILDEVEQAVGDDVPPGDRARLHAFFDALMRNLSEDLILEQRYYEHIPSELLFERLSRPLMRQIVDRGLASGALTGDDLEMLLSFGLGGLFSLYRWWFLSDRSIPLEEVTRRAGLLVEGGVSELLD
ncbi:TetR/AcrR family transcriptional regulator [Thermophilibacter mediterraneus]|uniref:TetR/AcrR family transcriptional regulator n=1 Tax=Thermophilibacter mediterraneus TaxID=1871031 RepID=UPI0009319A7C|nr:TetR/AcrR family transcriptional regulator [Thermophilibacter mediterraneus]